MFHQTEYIWTKLKAQEKKGFFFLYLANSVLIPDITGLYVTIFKYTVGLHLVCQFITVHGDNPKYTAVLRLFILNLP